MTTTQPDNFTFAEFVSCAKELQSEGNLYYSTQNRGDKSCGESWDGNVRPSQALDMATNGDTSMVQTIDADITSLTEGMASATATVWESHMVGSRVNVPAFIAGNPMNMRRRVKREVSTRHVNIGIGMMVSAGVSAANMSKRGAAILGLLQCLQTMQVATTVKLIIEFEGNVGDAPGKPDWRKGDGHEDHLYAVELDTNPFSIAQVGFAIAHVAFTRNVLFAVAHHRNGLTDSGWSAAASRTRDYGNGRGMVLESAAYIKGLKERLGMAEHDIYIPGAYLYDPSIQTPEKWIRERVAEVKLA